MWWWIVWRTSINVVRFVSGCPFTCSSCLTSFRSHPFAPSVVVFPIHAYRCPSAQTHHAHHSRTEALVCFRQEHRTCHRAGQKIHTACNRVFQREFATARSTPTDIQHRGIGHRLRLNHFVGTPSRDPDMLLMRVICLYGTPKIDFDIDTKALQPSFWVVI